MEISGLPERFWVVTEPSPSTEDMCFACTFEGLMRRVLGGLQEDEIMGFYANESEARKAAARVVGGFPVRPCDALAVEVTVQVLVIPKSEEMSAKKLAKAAVEAVRNAVRQAEEAGFRYHLHGKVSLGAGTVDLRNLSVLLGGQAVLG